MEFVARIGTPEGRVEEKSFDATDAESLRGDLEKRGLHVFEVRRRGLALTRKGLARGRGRRLSGERFLVFNQELAALLRAGLPLMQSLDLMLERMDDPAFRPILTDIRDRVRSGEELSDAFGSYGKVFPRLYAPTLKAGERSGDLEEVIRRFIRYQRLLLGARKKAVSALVYPAVLIGLSIAMILVMTLFVVPKFSQFFVDTGSELPAITQVVLSVSGFAIARPLGVPNGAIVAVAVVVGLFVLRGWVRTPAGERALDRGKLRLPFLGSVFHRFALSEFCRSLATLLSGGLPLVPSFEIAVGAVGNAHVRGEIAPTIQLVREGRPFHAALEASGQVPAMAIDMIKVGEATGSLDEMLTAVSDLFDDQVEIQLQRILALVEPLMLVFMGLIIGILLVSIYLPLFGAMGNVS